MKHPVPPRRHILALAACAALGTLPLSAQADTFVWNTGTYVPGITSPNPLAAGDVLSIENGGFKYLSGTQLVNHGRVNWLADSLYLQSGAVVDNHGLWDVQADLSLVNNGGAQPVFNNLGTFRKSAGAGVANVNLGGFVNSGVIDAQSGAIHFNGGGSFNAGSSFIGAGRSRMKAGVNTFNGAFSASNLDLQNGSFQGNAAVLNGQVDYTGGTVQGGWTVASGQTLTGRSGAFKYLSGAGTVLTNQGRIGWDTSDSWYLQSGASLLNQGLFEATASASLVNNGGGMPVFTNTVTGTVRAAAGQTLNIGGVAFVNDAGRLEAAAGATLSFSGGAASFNDGTLFTGAGQSVVSNNARFAGGFTSDNLVITGAVQTGDNAVISGQLAWAGGRLVGTWAVAAGQVLQAGNGAFKYLSGAGTVLSNLGRISWNTGDSLYLESGASLVNQGVFEAGASATLVNNGGATPSLVNTALGTLRAGAGTTLSIGSVAFNNQGGTLDAAAGGTLQYGGGAAVFDAGSLFTGAGRNLVTNHARFNGSFQSQNLVLQSGTYLGDAAVLNGQVLLTGGRLIGDWTVAANQRLDVGGGAFKYLSGAGTVLSNAGRIVWGSTDSLYLESGASLVNQGQFEAAASTSLVNNGGGTPSVTNTATGTLRALAGQTLTIGGVAFSNDGGTLRADTGATIQYGGGNAVFNSGTRFVGDGRNLVTFNAAFNGAIQSQNLVLQGGTLAGGGAALTGLAKWTGGRMTGTWDLLAGQRLDVGDGAFKYLSGAGTEWVNHGLVAWATGNSLYLESGAVFDNRGTLDFQADGALTNNGGASPSVVNHGLILKSGGAGAATIGNGLGFSNLGTLDVRSGTLRLPTAFVNDGVMTGSGSFETSLLSNQGHVAPGASIGALALNGSYLQAAGGSFDVQLAGLASFDQFNITGAAALGGTLALQCAGACNLAVGDTYVLLDSAGPLSGSFSHVTVAGFGNGFQYDLVYDYDGADQVRLTVLQTGVVPEPGSWALMLAGLVAVGRLARRRR